MTAKVLPRLVAGLLVLSALGGLVLPAKAALVYAGCMDTATDLAGGNAQPAASGGAIPPTGVSCVDETQLGDPIPGEAPANEYLDPLTHVVYQQTPAGLQPIGFGSNSGYLEVQTQTNHHNGDQCDDSVTTVVCLEPLMDCFNEYAVCQSLRIALAGCHQVQLDVVFSISVTGWSIDDPHDYPQTCPPSPLGVLGPIVDWSIPPAAQTTALKADFSEPAPYGSCRLAYDYGVPLDVFTFLYVDGARQGTTHVTLTQC